MTGPVRGPASVPDVPVDVRGGLDTDGDGHPDTVLNHTAGELLVFTDLDGDGFADQVLAIGPDGGWRLLDPDPGDGWPD